MQNSKAKEDLRVRRTRQTLQKALIELTVEKGYSAITIQDITERAMVNRSTFYRHYLDKCDLLNQYMNEVYALISESPASGEKMNRTPNETPSGLVKLLRHVQQFANFYRIMLGAEGDPGFTAHFRQNVEKRFRYLLANAGAIADPKGPPADFRLSYISYADVGAITWWLENDQPCTPEQLASWIGQFGASNAGLPWAPKHDWA